MTIAEWLFCLLCSFSIGYTTADVFLNSKKKMFDRAVAAIALVAYFILACRFVRFS